MHVWKNFKVQVHILIQIANESVNQLRFCAVVSVQLPLTSSPAVAHTHEHIHATTYIPTSTISEVMLDMIITRVWTRKIFHSPYIFIYYKTVLSCKMITLLHTSRQLYRGCGTYTTNWWASTFPVKDQGVTHPPTYVPALWPSYSSSCRPCFSWYKCCPSAPTQME